MTNKEILQADMLDILFEHRNKLYGAYALRKTYTHRLGLALVVALSTPLLFILMSFLSKNSDENNSSSQNENLVQLTEIDFTKPDHPEPPKPKPEIKPAPAQVDYQQFKIVDDRDADKEIADLTDIQNADISNKTIAGDTPADGLANTVIETTGTNNASTKEPGEIKPVLPNRQAGFPGGTAAWLDFLRKFLQAPEEIEPGQRIEVQVRFWIGVDGKISNPEIIKSGGKSFDKEVLRVLKKMPPWEPAIQNGNYIAVAYTQPVIFIGVEE